ncbi:hypothetical protein FB001_12384 [Ensifer sp. SEMIA 135]|nr:hypothetical protein FB001_12384 [Ensifer sp. SEMIA 135]
MTLPIETPAVLVDLDIARRNVLAFQAYADRHGIRVRPHIKPTSFRRWPSCSSMQGRSASPARR